MWVVSKISGTTGALGAEVVDLRSWLIHFRCASEELRVVIFKLAEWMSNSSPPGSPIVHLLIFAYCRWIKGQGCALWESGRRSAGPSPNLF